MVRWEFCSIFRAPDRSRQSLIWSRPFKALGLRMVQLTYNRKDYVGDGCEEEIDGGLSRFGKALVRRLNENRIVVDCTHTGYKTTMDALSLTTRPAVFSHSNSAAVFPSKRNIKDDQGGGGLGWACRRHRCPPVRCACQRRRSAPVA